MGDQIITEITAGVATLVVNRPEHRNATSPEMLQEMADFLALADTDPAVRCVVIKAAGEHFIGGGDIRSFEPTLTLPAQERGAIFERRLMAVAHLYHRLERLRKPLVVVARGAIAGAGTTFALAADITIISETAFFFFAHGQLGLSLDGGVSYYLPRVVGWRKAKELALLNARVAAPEALALGLASRLVPDAELDDAAQKYIEQLKNGPTRAMGLTKSLLEHSLGNSINEQIRMESEACAQCTSGEDFREGVSAFLEKRKPTFSGQ